MIIFYLPDFLLLCLKSRKAINQAFNMGSGIAYSGGNIYKRISKILRLYIKPSFMSSVSGQPKMTLANIQKARN
ncbi:unnamed protein product, partial [marine sediment metagenome]